VVLGLVMDVSLHLLHLGNAEAECTVSCLCCSLKPGWLWPDCFP